MRTKENLHSGHRDRMTEKFMMNPSYMHEHEILEMLLYYAIPRVDTNPIAHRLLRMFGSLNGVFKATPEKLSAVEGVGDKTACFISLIGEISKRTCVHEDALSNIDTFAFHKNKDDLIAYFKNFKEERFIILMFNDKLKLLSHAQFSDDNVSSVSADIPEIAFAFAIHKPKYAIIAHNHPSGNAMPSTADDFATAKLNAICSLHGVSLVDHIICTKNDAYSYHYDNKLDKIKRDYDLSKFFGKKQGE